MSAVYGERVRDITDPMPSTIVDATAKLTNMLSPGATPPVDLIPLLKYIPKRWAWWERLAEEIRHLEHKFTFGMLEKCEKRVAAGKSSHAFLDEVLERKEEFGLSRDFLA